TVHDLDRRDGHPARRNRPTAAHQGPLEQAPPQAAGEPDDPTNIVQRLLSHAGFQHAGARGPVRIPRTPRGVRRPLASPDAATTPRHTAPAAQPSPRRSSPTGIPPEPSRRMSPPEFTLLPDGLPAIPRRHRSVGPEPLALPLKLLRRQELPQAVGQRVALANAIVPDRPHVEPPQLEDQEHLRGPPSDASHDREAGDDLLVDEPAEAI